MASVQNHLFQLGNEGKKAAEDLLESEYALKVEKMRADHAGEMVELRRKLKAEAKATVAASEEVQDSLKKKVMALTAANIAQKVMVGKSARAESVIATEKSSVKVVVAKPVVPTGKVMVSPTTVCGPRPVVTPLSGAPAFGKDDTVSGAVLATKEMEKMTVNKAVSSFLLEEFSDSESDSE